MKKTEWLEYFELVNGREPNEEELSQALKVGEYEKEVSESLTSVEAKSEELISEGKEVPRAKSLTESQHELVSDVSSSSEPDISTPLQSEALSEASTPTAQLTSTAVTNKKFCVNCAHQLALEAKFCTKCGAAQNGATPSSLSSGVATSSDLQKILDGYWKWLKKVLKYPISTTTSEMTDNYLWMTFGIIVGFLSIGFAILLGSFSFFFIMLIVGGGLTLLLNALYGALANGLMKTKFKFFDIFKMNMQASIYAVPVSVSVFVFCILAKLMLNSAMRNPYNNFTSSLVFVNFLGFVIYAMLAFVGLIGADLFIMAIHREILAVEGSKIDNYPWFKLLYVVIVTVIVFILFLLLGTLLLSIIGDNFLNMLG